MSKNQQYQLAFNHFDANGDGKISASELQQCFNVVGPIGSGAELSLADAEVAVVLMDTDGDGLLCFEEFVKLVEFGVEKEEEEEESGNDLKETFRLYEMEGSGCITPNSLNRMLRRLGEIRTVEECAAMIHCFDLNGDGMLNFHEFEVMMMSC